MRYGFGAAPAVEYYGAFAQRPLSSQTVVLKTLPGFDGVPAAARRVVRALAPDLPVRTRWLAEAAAADPGYRSARIGTAILKVLRRRLADVGVEVVTKCRIV